MYNISILYLDKCFQVLFSCDFEHLWRLPFGAKMVRNITWRMAFLTWTKPGDNLEFFG